jgi:hypothetical protein
MEGQDTLSKLNGYKVWTGMDPQRRSEAYETISALADVFQRVGPENRRFISAGLRISAKRGMAEYTRDKAVEGMRSGSKVLIIQGLIPVVMAGGRCDSPTAGSLLSLILHSAEKCGLDAREIFGYAAQFADDPKAAVQMRDYPLLPRNLSDIKRYGYHERKTPDGLTFEHPVEAMSRPRWWDKLLLRKRVSREKIEQGLREWEELWSENPDY